jgi:hypothetical protein
MKAETERKHPPKLQVSGDQLMVDHEPESSELTGQVVQWVHDGAHSIVGTEWCG